MGRIAVAPAPTRPRTPSTAERAPPRASRTKSALLRFSTCRVCAPAETSCFRRLPHRHVDRHVQLRDLRIDLRGGQRLHGRNVSRSHRRLVDARQRRAAHGRERRRAGGTSDDRRVDDAGRSHERAQPGRDRERSRLRELRRRLRRNVPRRRAQPRRRLAALDLQLRCRGRRRIPERRRRCRLPADEPRNSGPIHSASGPSTPSAGRSDGPPCSDPNGSTSGLRSSSADRCTWMVAPTEASTGSLRAPSGQLFFNSSDRTGTTPGAPRISAASSYTFVDSTGPFSRRALRRALHRAASR